MAIACAWGWAPHWTLFCIVSSLVLVLYRIYAPGNSIVPGDFLCMLLQNNDWESYKRCRSLQSGYFCPWVRPLERVRAFIFPWFACGCAPAYHVSKQNLRPRRNCTRILLVSTGPNLELVPPPQRAERNWLPLAIAAGVVLVVAVVVVLVLQSRHKATAVTPVNAALDPYAASLPITGIVMSESPIPAGGKLTYVDGHIVNHGNRTVTGISVQVLFRTFAHEVTQNETHPLQWIRTREPYIDVEPVSAHPLKPGEERDFRLIFDGVSPDWDGAYPEIRILRVDGN